MPTFKDKLKKIQRNLSASLEVETERISGIVKKTPLEKLKQVMPNLRDQNDDNLMNTPIKKSSKQPNKESNQVQLEAHASVTAAQKGDTEAQSIH